MNMQAIKNLCIKHNMLREDGNTLKSAITYIEQLPKGYYTKIIFENGKTIEG